MEVQGQFTIYESGEIWSGIEEALRNADFAQFHAPFGYKVIEVNGKKKWQAMTEAEWREKEAAFQGISPEEVTQSGCPNDPSTCWGGCGSGPCVVVHDSTGGLWCSCRGPH